MFPLIQSSPLDIIFDPVSTEARLPSVAFDVTASWSMPFQTAQIIIREVWVEYAELNRFEEELKGFGNNQVDKTNLRDMNSNAVIVIQRNDDDILFEFRAVDAAKMGVVSIKSNLYEQEITEIIENIKSWSKWW